MPPHGGRRAEPSETATRASGAQSIPDAAFLSLARPNRLRSRRGKLARAAGENGRRAGRAIAAAEPAYSGRAAALARPIKGGARPPGRAPELAEPAKCVVPIPCSLRRSLQGSGRSAPSRDKPLTARLVGRRGRERRGANRARSNFISPHHPTVCLSVASVCTAGRNTTGPPRGVLRPGAIARGSTRGGYVDGV